jgi:drug/metabolite transporter (DMT)-like permease
VQVSKTRIFLSLSVGILAASFASIFIRLAQAAGMPSLVIAAWRLIFASVILMPYAWFMRRDEISRLSRTEWGLLAVAGLCLGLHFATWITSLAYTSVASAVVLVSMGPVFVGLGSWLFLNERPGRKTMAGIALTVVGSIIIGLADFGHGEDALLGDLLALAGAVFVAAYLMIGRKVRGSRSLTTYVALVYGFAMLCLVGMVLLSRQSLLGYSAQAYGWALALGLGPQLIGHSALNWALGYLSATFVSIVTLAEPIGSGILAFFILGEAITMLTAVGAALVLAGIYIASRVELD